MSPDSDPSLASNKLVPVSSQWNRVFLLDSLVFFVNFGLIFLLTRRFAALAPQASEDRQVETVIAWFCVGSAFLLPLGAIFKRRPAHRRVPNLRLSQPWSWLCNPVFFFLSQLLFLIAVGTSVADWYRFKFHLPLAAEGTDYFGLPPWLFATLFLGVPLLAAANTAAAFIYFIRPKRDPWLKFLDSPGAEIFGDACLFLNSILYQVFWGYLMMELPRDYTGIFGRLFQLGFTALLIYFPPRIFYFAEYGDRRSTWVMMLVANSPLLVGLFLIRSGGTW